MGNVAVVMRKFRMIPAALLLVASLQAAGAEPAIPAGRDDAALEAFALAAAEAHERADREAPEAALRTLLAVIPAELPAGPEARLVEAELAARASALCLAQGDAAEAFAIARRALDRQGGAPETAARALLKLREGEALEALGRDEAALEAWAEAIGVASRLLAGGAR